jgi:thioredoxin-like negative regulator of GroEL
MTTSPAPQLLCLCAAWCRLCDDYAAVFQQVVELLRADWPLLRARWIDIEDEAELVGDLDIETFPTVVLLAGAELRFAGTLTPQATTLERVVRSALRDGAIASTSAPDPALSGFVQRLIAAS